jgi:hypothetical protein
MSDSRTRTDALTTVSATLPNAANTVNTNGVDLGAVRPFPLTESVQVKLSLTAATGANNKNINIRLMDSADNSSFTNVAVVANPVLRSTDDADNGHSAANVIISMPRAIRRYVRATALGEADGGDSSDGTFAITLLF